MQVLISLFGKNTNHGKYNRTIPPKSNVRIHLFYVKQILCRQFTLLTKFPNNSDILS